MNQRYYVLVWQGESGALGQLIDRRTGRILWVTSTYVDGLHWRALLDSKCNELNATNA